MDGIQNLFQGVTTVTDISGSLEGLSEDERFKAICVAYKQMYFSAKNDKERKDKINAFRCGIIK